MDSLHNLLPVLGIALILASLWARRFAPRCPQCDRTYTKSASFCAGCGFLLTSVPKAKLSEPMDSATILHKVDRAAFAYISGFFPLWLFLFFATLPAGTLMLALGAYTIFGAAIVLLIYHRLSRCSACGHFVQLGKAKAFSAAYCSHCGNQVNEEQKSHRPSA